MYFEDCEDVYELNNIVVRDQVKQKDHQKDHRNAPKKAHFSFGRKMLSLFRSSRSGRGKQRSVKSPVIPKIYPVKQRSGQHSRHSLNDDDPECFHRAVGTILLMAQFFGILPINYIRSDNIKKFTYRRFGPRAIYSYCVLFGMLVIASICFIHLFRTLSANGFRTKGGITDATVGAVFYGNGLFGNIMFLRLCPRWISIQYDWRAMERLLDNTTGVPWKRPKLRWRLWLIAGSILGLALVEHLLSMINNTPLEYFTTNHTLEDFLEVYTNKSNKFIIRNIDYNFTLGLFIFVVSKFSTFTWNFTDVFIMMIATGIAERYKYLNDSVTESSMAQLTITDWHRIRESYAVLSALVKRVDKEISGIILLSFINNIYFICLQLLNGLSPSDNGNPIFNSIYFFGSFIFLIGRTTAVTLLTARINDQCKVILPVLYNCPSINYCVEAQRLQQQIATDDVALTGNRFFSITRNFMLAVGGAIITYEVVLLQFNTALQGPEDD